MNKWTNTGNYMGADWSDWYVLISQTRDSDALDRSNFRCALKQFEDVNADVVSDGEEMCSPQVARFNHWGCGWIEAIMIHESHAEAIAIGEAIQAGLSDYPVINDEDYSAEEWNVAESYWQGASIRERAEFCKGADVSVFAARHNDLSVALQGDDSGRLFDSLRAE